MSETRPPARSPSPSAREASSATGKSETPKVITAPG